MRKRSGPKGGRKASHLIRRSFASLLLVAAVFVPIVHAQSGPPAWPRQRSSDEARPVIVERRAVGDPRPRIELRFGEPWERCTTWRFETWVQTNGDAVFELKEPADKTVLLGLENSERHIEFVIGDAQCSYRIRIERNK